MNTNAMKSSIQGRDGRDGQPGKDGSPGTPGRDGKDFASLNLLREAINETVQRGLCDIYLVVSLF